MPEGAPKAPGVYCVSTQRCLSALGRLLEARISTQRRKDSQRRKKQRIEEREREIAWSTGKRAFHSPPFCVFASPCAFALKSGTWAGGFSAFLWDVATACTPDVLGLDLLAASPLAGRAVE